MDVNCERETRPRDSTWVQNQTAGVAVPIAAFSQRPATPTMFKGILPTKRLASEFTIVNDPNVLMGKENTPTDSMQPPTRPKSRSSSKPRPSKRQSEIQQTEQPMEAVVMNQAFDRLLVSFCDVAFTYLH
jgi:hypothetical protein